MPKATEKRVIGAQFRRDIDFLTKFAFETWEYWESDFDVKVGKRLAALAGNLPGYNKKLDEIHKRRKEGT